VNAPSASVKLSLDDALALAEEHAGAGRHSAAAEVLRQVLRVAPDHPAAEVALARSLQAQGRLPAAIDFLQSAAARRPRDGAVRLMFGEFLLNQGRRADAALVLAQAAELAPADARPPLLAGRCCLELGRHELAIVHLNAAIARDPALAEAHRLLGRALADCGRRAEASACLRKAVALSPADAETHAELGRLLTAEGHSGEALDSFHLAVAMAPKSQGLEFERAQLLLRRGNYPHGWLAYEARLVERARRREFRAARWQGEPLEGRRLLVHAEPDLAETIQFLRLAAALPAREGQILLELPLDLIGLAAHSLADLGLRTVRRGGTEAFDLHCPLLSLPGLLNVLPDAVPGRIPYLRPTAAASGRWQRRLAALLPQHGLCVGLAGEHPLPALPGILPVWLERNHPAPPGTLPLGREITDLSDLAAIIVELDLVIGEDRPALHLAGALGKPAWVLLPHVAHWRWLEDRADSPWYPSVRLFRQLRDEDPTALAERLRAALREVF
jgi:tetratricopeptide (TPR) repeat protein